MLWACCVGFCLFVCGSEGVHTHRESREPMRGLLSSVREGSCHAGSRDTLEMKIVCVIWARACCGARTGDVQEEQTRRIKQNRTHNSPLQFIHSLCLHTLVAAPQLRGTRPDALSPRSLINRSALLHSPRKLPPRRAPCAAPQPRRSCLRGERESTHVPLTLSSRHKSVRDDFFVDPHQMVASSFTTWRRAGTSRIPAAQSAASCTSSTPS